MAIVAADGHHRAIPHIIYHLEDVMAFYADDARGRPAGRPADVPPLDGSGQVTGAVDAGVVHHPDAAPGDAGG
jgi:hypothetical protein